MRPQFTTTTIGGVEVRQGAVITSIESTEAILGQRIEVGGRCEQMRPQTWTAVITANGAVIWESDDTFDTHNAARATANARRRERLDQAVANLFG